MESKHNILPPISPLQPDIPPQRLKYHWNISGTPKYSVKKNPIASHHHNHGTMPLSSSPTHKTLSIAKYTHSWRKTSRDYESGWTKRRPKGTFDHPHLLLHHPSFKFQRKMGNYAPYRIIMSSTVIQSKTMPPSLTLKSPYQLLPTHSSFPLSISGGGITTSISMMGTNGKQCSKPVLVSGNPWLCTLCQGLVEPWVPDMGVGTVSTRICVLQGSMWVQWLKRQVICGRDERNKTQK